VLFLVEPSLQTCVVNPFGGSPTHAWIYPLLSRVIFIGPKANPTGPPLKKRGISFKKFFFYLDNTLREEILADLADCLKSGQYFSPKFIFHHQNFFRPILIFSRTVKINSVKFDFLCFSADEKVLVSPGRFIPFCRDSITERFSSLQIRSFTSPQNKLIIRSSVKFNFFSYLPK